MSMHVTSDVLQEGALIPRQYTGEGDDQSPPLAWTGAPDDVQEFALICSDPDAPRGVWHHWVIYNLPPEVTALPAALPREAELKTPVAARQGRNSWPRDNVGYRGPMPPPGDGSHRYQFTVYALDAHIELAPERADAAALQRAMEGHVLARGQLTGTYQRK